VGQAERRISEPEVVLDLEAGRAVHLAALGCQLVEDRPSVHRVSADDEN
jgi:hypothetical protein